MIPVGSDLGDHVSDSACMGSYGVDAGCVHGAVRGVVIVCRLSCLVCFIRPDVRSPHSLVWRT